jgi:molecular chaperone IbpA
MTFNVPYLNTSSTLVGFENAFKRLNEAANSALKAASYPPYNIKKVEDNKYVVELAVAGFGKTDIDITIDDNILRIAGNTKPDDDNFLFKGIAERAFVRNFTLADTIEVKNAEIINGMLKIWLENIIPDNKKPRKVEVTELGPKPEKEYLKG